MISVLQGQPLEGNLLRPLRLAYSQIIDCERISKMAIGELSGVPPRQQFGSRRELYDADVHRTLQAGIFGSGHRGAESIVLSGGYADDEDYGDVIIYTGHGGRDPASGRQVADQTFTRQNRALVTSSLEGLLIRVIRGSEHRSPFSPATGYRYDGLFRIESYWQERGRDGFLVCRYRLVADQTRDLAVTADAAAGESARRAVTNVQRIVRDTALGREVKRLHDYRCQVCGIRLDCAGGPYAEAAHIRPLGRPHDGPDDLANLLCLCPNHHVLLDNGAFGIGDTLMLIGLPGTLALVRGHRIDARHLAFHRQIWRFT
jgi:putative restriction endonuclease